MAAHEEALNESPFFRIALKKEWLDGRTRQIDLPDDDVITIEYYVHFLYTQQKVLDLNFKDAVLMRMLYETVEYWKGEIFHDYPVALLAVQIMYEGTPPVSLGRKLLVDIFHAAAPPDWVDDNHPTEFRDELLFKFMGSHGSRELDNLDISAYLEDVKDDD